MTADDASRCPRGAGSDGEDGIRRASRAQVTISLDRRNSVERKEAETSMRAASMVTILAALTLMAAAAHGRDYAFCAYGGKTSETMRCDYTTLAQCQASTAGAGGSCVANPGGGQTAKTARGGASPKR
jgi:hypothetical protein